MVIKFPKTIKDDPFYNWNSPQEIPGARPFSQQPHYRRLLMGQYTRLRGSAGNPLKNGFAARNYSGEIVVSYYPPSEGLFVD